jgi:hypothetical protein
MAERACADCHHRCDEADMCETLELTLICESCADARLEARLALVTGSREAPMEERQPGGMVKDEPTLRLPGRGGVPREDACAPVHQPVNVGRDRLRPTGATVPDAPPRPSGTEAVGDMGGTKAVRKPDLPAVSEAVR